MPADHRQVLLSPFILRLRLEHSQDQVLRFAQLTPTQQQLAQFQGGWNKRGVHTQRSPIMKLGGFQFTLMFVNRSKIMVREVLCANGHDLLVEDPRLLDVALLQVSQREIVLHHEIVLRHLDRM